MQGYTSSDDHQPLFRIQGYPVYATTFLIGLFTASMIIVTMLETTGYRGILTLMDFSTDEVKHGAIWRIFTYSLVNEPSVGFVINMLMLWWFGREVERFFGRKMFLRFYGANLLIPPILFLLCNWDFPLIGVPGSVGVFVAFATLYPDALLLFNILAKWMAILWVGILSMIDLSHHDWPELLILWFAVGWAYAFVRYEQGRFTLPSISLKRLFSARKKPKFRVVPRTEPRRSSLEPDLPVIPDEDDEVNSINPLLDKIARSGIDSLTSAEKARLEKARLNLLKKNH